MTNARSRRIFARDAVLTKQTAEALEPAEVVLAQPIHGLLRVKAAILAVEN
jgi:hypothetical protein